jgi:hypothetical protein
MDHALDASPLQVGDHGIESGQVAVDVRDDS